MHTSYTDKNDVNITIDALEPAYTLSAATIIVTQSISGGMSIVFIGSPWTLGDLSVVTAQFKSHNSCGYKRHNRELFVQAYELGLYQDMISHFDQLHVTQCKPFRRAIDAFLAS